jgi:hypothetical protein
MGRGWGVPPSGKVFVVVRASSVGDAASRLNSATIMDWLAVIVGFLTLEPPKKLERSEGSA